MCTGITHIFHCRQCTGIVYKLQEACPGFTCRAARDNKRRGTCRDGIAYSRYHKLSDELCLSCDLEVELQFITMAESCPEGGEPWSEDDDDDDVVVFKPRRRGANKGCESESEGESRGEEEEAEEEEEEDGGAKTRKFRCRIFSSRSKR
ncbi:hypothetical protein GGS20DRAFT_580872 [Poronia punctata]|nr:hypothetical protein GGS20DRAFT_580872 [Poronia punctata]